MTAAAPAAEQPQPQTCREPARRRAHPAAAPAADRDPDRRPAGHLPGRPRPDDRGHRAAGDRDRPQGQRRLRLGLHVVPADRDRQRADLRKAVRPLRPAADLHDRRQHLPARLDAVPACRRRCGSSSLFRGIQGLGAGALFPVSLAIIGDIFAPSERGKYQGFFGAVFGVSLPDRSGARRVPHR